MAGIIRYDHHMLVTKNSKYDLVDNVCVAVHDQRTGLPNLSHPALGARIAGAMRKFGNGGVEVRPGLPVEGESLIFSNDVVTSPLVSVLCVASRGPADQWSSAPALPCSLSCQTEGPCCGRGHPIPLPASA